jgi:hypothetical protein
MKKLLVVLSTVLATSASSASADLVHQFKNPSFSGIGYSAHVLSIEQLEFNRNEDLRKEREAEQTRLERELENSVLNKFIKNLESRIYATLSKQMVDNMFAACGEDTGVECANSGTTTVEGASIAWVKDPETGSITLTVDGPDGYTEITIPGPGEFTF